MKVLAIDPGEKRIGVAVSDPTGTLARPLMILEHTSLSEDVKKIINIADEGECEIILIGQALLADGTVGYRARLSSRLREQIQNHSNKITLLWDESFTTKQALDMRIKAGVSKKKRKAPVDDLAAALLLDEFLGSKKFMEMKEIKDE